MKSYLLAVAAFICFVLFLASDIDSKSLSTSLVNTKNVDTVWTNWAKEVSFSEWSINKFNLVGSVTHEFTGFANQPEREKMRDLSDRDYKIQMLRFPNLKVQSLEFLNHDSPNKPLRRIAICTLTNAVTMMHDYLSLQLPMITDFTYNPFANVEHNESKFTFSHKVSHESKMSIEIPSGYEVAAMPESTEGLLPNDGGKIHYLNFISDNKIHVTVRFQLLKTEYNDGEYAMIRQYQQKLMAKKVEITLLRKKPDMTAKKN